MGRIFAAPYQMQKLSKISDASFQKALACEKRAITECQSIEKLHWENSSTYEKVVTTFTAARGDSKFTALKGEVLINADINTVLADVHDLREFTPEMPEKEKDGKVCRYIYFPSDQVKKQVMTIKEKKGVQAGNAYLCYQIVQGPPMVSNREFVILKTTIDQSGANGKRYFIAQRSVDIDEKCADKVVRSDLTSAVVLEEAGGKTKLTTYFHADPNGSLPAALFNMKLNSQNNFAVELCNKYK